MRLEAQDRPRFEARASPGGREKRESLGRDKILSNS